jgi:Ca2+-binding EF-hand superfamily protein
MKYSYLVAGMIGFTLAGATALAPAAEAAIPTVQVAAATNAESAPKRLTREQRAERMQAMRDRFPIDLNALDEQAQSAFDAVDAAGDGVIRREEFVAADLPREAMRGPVMHRGPHARAHGGQQHWGQRGGERGPRAERGERSAAAEQRRADWREQRQARRAEWEQRVFERADADGDGTLSPDEFARIPEVRRELAREQMFDRLDRNNDGVLDRDEFPVWWARLQAMDADNDGQVTFEEMRAYRSDQREQHGYRGFQRQR